MLSSEKKEAKNLSFYEQRRKINLGKIKKFGLNVGLWEYFFDNRLSFNASFVIPIVGVPSSGKTMLATDISSILSANYLIPSSSLRLSVSQHDNFKSLYRNIDSEMADFFQNVSKMKICSKNISNRSEARKFSILLKECDLDIKDNVGNCLATSYALAHSYYLNKLLSKQPNAVIIVEGVHLAGYPEVIRSGCQEYEDYGDFTFLVKDSIAYIYIPISLVFKNNKPLIDSYTRKKKMIEHKRELSKYAKDNINTVIKFNRVIKKLSSQRGGQAIIIDSGLKYKELAIQSLQKIEKAIEFCKKNKKHLTKFKRENKKEHIIL